MKTGLSAVELQKRLVVFVGTVTILLSVVLAQAGWRPDMSDIVPIDAVSVEDGQAVVVMYSGGLNAFMFTGWKPLDGSGLLSRTYSWCVLGVSTNGMETMGTNLCGTGYVCENYKRFPEGAATRLVDNGSELFIHCGSIDLEWSSPSWIYLPESDTSQKVLLGVVATTNLNGIDYRGDRVRWYCAGEGYKNSSEGKSLDAASEDHKTPNGKE